MVTADASLQDSPPLPLASRWVLRWAQEVSRYVLPRGFPHMIWVGRRLLMGSGIRKVWYRHLFQVYCDIDSYPSLMAACGFVYRRMERVLDSLIKPPAIFLDVGANVGFVTLLACSLRRIDGEVRAHCFEPDPGVFTWLSRNRKLNSFDMVLNPCAVGAVEGEGELTISSRPGWSTMAAEPPGGFTFLPKAGKTVVQVTTLDAYCSEHRITPSLIKIDVEGFETQVVEGGRTILERTRPYLLVEANPLRLAAAGTSGEELFGQLADLHYELYHVDQRSAKTHDALRRKTWRGLREVDLEDLVEGRDFDIVAVPGE